MDGQLPQDVAVVTNALACERERADQACADADQLRLELGRERRLSAEAAARASVAGAETDARHEADKQELKHRLQETERRTRQMQREYGHTSAVQAETHAELPMHSQEKLLAEVTAAREEIMKMSGLLRQAATDSERLREHNVQLEDRLARLEDNQESCRLCRDRAVRSSIDKLPDAASSAEDALVQDGTPNLEITGKERSPSPERTVPRGGTRPWTAGNHSLDRTKHTHGQAAVPYTNLELARQCDSKQAVDMLTRRPASALPGRSNATARPSSSERDDKRSSDLNQGASSSSCSTRASTRLSQRTPPPVFAPLTTTSELARPAAEVDLIGDSGDQLDLDTELIEADLAGQVGRSRGASFACPFSPTPDIATEASVKEDAVRSHTPQIEEHTKMADEVASVGRVLDDADKANAGRTAQASPAPDPVRKPDDKKADQVSPTPAADKVEATEAAPVAKRRMSWKDSVKLMGKWHMTIMAAREAAEPEGFEAVAAAAAYVEKVAAREAAQESVAGAGFQRRSSWTHEIPDGEVHDEATDGGSPTGKKSINKPGRGNALGLGKAEEAAGKLIAMLQKKEEERMKKVESPEEKLAAMETQLLSWRSIRDSDPNQCDEAHANLVEFWDDIMSKRLQRDRYNFKHVFRPSPPHEPPPPLRPRERVVIRQPEAKVKVMSRPASARPAAKNWWQTDEGDDDNREGNFRHYGLEAFPRATRLLTDFAHEFSPSLLDVFQKAPATGPTLGDSSNSVRRPRYGRQRTKESDGGDSSPGSPRSVASTDSRSVYNLKPPEQRTQDNRSHGHQWQRPQSAPRKSWQAAVQHINHGTRHQAMSRASEIPRPPSSLL